MATSDQDKIEIAIKELEPEVRAALKDIMKGSGGVTISIDDGSKRIQAGEWSGNVYKYSFSVE